MNLNFIVFFCLLAISNISFSQNLKDVTLGFGTGLKYNFNKTYDYSLTTDTMHALKMQNVPNTAFVISSIITVKFKKLKVDEEEKNILKRNGTPAKPKDKIALNIALNMLEIKQDASFNKSIDGGIGIGYFIHQSTQIAVMFDVSKVRQLRQHIVDLYENKRIPNGTNYYNALDNNDNNLFYDKPVFGISIKGVFSL